MGGCETLIKVKNYQKRQYKIKGKQQTQKTNLERSQQLSKPDSESIVAVDLEDAQEQEGLGKQLFKQKKSQSFDLIFQSNQEELRDQKPPSQFPMTVKFRQDQKFTQNMIRQTILNYGKKYPVNNENLKITQIVTDENEQVERIVEYKYENGKLSIIKEAEENLEQSTVYSQLAIEVTTSHMEESEAKEENKTKSLVYQRNKSILQLK